VTDRYVLYVYCLINYILWTIAIGIGSEWVNVFSLIADDSGCAG